MQPVQGPDSKPLFPVLFRCVLDPHAARFVLVTTAGIRMTPSESHLWHLPCAFRGAIRRQSRHSKSLLGELEAFRSQDGGVTIDLAGPENELLQSWISCSVESMALLADTHFLVSLCFVESGLQAKRASPKPAPNADKAVNT